MMGVLSLGGPGVKISEKRTARELVHTGPSLGGGGQDGGNKKPSGCLVHGG